MLQARYVNALVTGPQTFEKGGCEFKELYKVGCEP